jgi:hypothetical protein
VYCVSQKVGHLAIFVSAKVGAKQDEEFVQLMDVIDCLPPGLYEMVISPRPADVPAAGFVTGDWIARFEARSLDDIRALGRNSPEDDRAFAAVARLSELNLSIYRTFMQPFVRALANQPMADLAKALNPLRLSYTIFADSNPWMKGVQKLAAGVSAARRPVAADNPFLRCRRRSRRKSRPRWIPIAPRVTSWRSRCSSASTARRSSRRSSASPIAPSCGRSPSTSPEMLAARQAQADAYAAMLETGGFDEALTRAVLYVIAADRMLDQRCALALNVARQQLMHLSLAEFKVWCGTSSSCCNSNPSARSRCLRPWCRRRTRGRNC